MKRYKYAFVDGNYFLHRNFCASGGVSGIEMDDYFPNRLVASVTSSILSITGEFLIDKIIILWDTPPYNKVEFLKTKYKAGRYYMTVEDAEEIDDEGEREVALANAKNFLKRTEAKNKMKLLGQIGLPSVYRQGYEADDLIYILGKYCSEHQEEYLAISRDSDWMYWITECGTWYEPKKEVLLTYDEVVKQENINKGMSLFRYKTLYDSFYGSHNALVKTVTDEAWNIDQHILFDKFEKEGFTDEIFEDIDGARLQIKSFDFTQYPDYNYLESVYESLSSIGTAPSLSRIPEVSNELLVDFNSDKFKHYYNTLDQKLFLE